MQRNNFTIGTERTWDRKAPARRIVEAVARAKDVEPLDLDPLYYSLDGDALDDLFAYSNPGVEVTVEYEGYTVTIRNTGEIELHA